MEWIVFSINRVYMLLLRPELSFYYMIYKLPYICRKRHKRHLVILSLKMEMKEIYTPVPCLLAEINQLPQHQHHYQVTER